MLAFMVMVLNAQATEVEIEGRRLAGPAESGVHQFMAVPYAYRQWMLNRIQSCPGAVLTAN